MCGSREGINMNCRNCGTTLRECGELQVTDKGLRCVKCINDPNRRRPKMVIKTGGSKPD